MKVLWALVSGKTSRDLVKMGRVRPELMRVVYSHLTDAEAAARLAGVVRADRQAAEATLRYVREGVEFSRGYDTDRAYRILEAAIKGTSPRPVRPQDAELSEREADRRRGTRRITQAGRDCVEGPGPEIRQRRGPSLSRGFSALQVGGG